MIRSLLYVPGNGWKFLGKAHERGADAIIIDLEDAVAEAAKDEARDALSQTVSAAAQNGALVFVRINSEPERMELDAVAACRAGAYGLYVPKVRSPTVLQTIDRILEPVEAELARAPMQLVPLIEDPAAIFEAREIARAKRVLGLSAGGEDIATALGGRPTPDVLRLPKQLIHLAAKAEGVKSFGLLRSVADYSDIDGMRMAAGEARDFGFDGASCIHPSVVPILNEAFAASEAEIAWARRVLDAASNAAAKGVGAFTLDEKFIDAPIIQRASKVLEQVGR